MNKPERSLHHGRIDGALSRRGFLIGAAGTGFTLAFARANWAVTDPAAAVAWKLFEPTIWYHIDRDGVVTVNVIRAEMGQHIGTALARILADELEADWNSVRIDAVDTDPKWGLMITGASWSVWQTYPLYSRAGAAGRIALIEEGARLLGLPKEICIARSSLVRGDGRSISYAEIVRRGNLSRSYSVDELQKLPIKPAAERRLIGQRVQAIDIPAKTNGTGRYGIDAEVDGMVYARPKVPPTRNGSKVVSVDDSAARSVPGYIRSVALEDPSGTVPGWVMVYADSFFAASRAADKVKVDWTSDDTAQVSEKDLLGHGAQLIENRAGGSLLIADPGVDAAFASAKSTLERTYTTATALNFQLEPVNALAFEKAGVWEIHTGNQWQSLILPTIAKALGVAQDKVIMRTYLLGGGFGRRLNGDYAVPAALAAKAIGRPVKMVCTRADDTRFASVRSPSIQRLRMAFDGNGKVMGMEHHACAGWPTQVLAPDFLKLFKGVNGEFYDTFAISGADHWYTVGSHRVRALSNDLANRAFRPGYLRSVGSGWVNWALESFMDEAARAVKRDPVEFRLAMLDGAGKNAGSSPNSVGGALRQARVLKRAADKGAWGSSVPEDTGLGIATTFGQERNMPTWTACVARVHVDRKSGRVTLEKLTVVIDAGTIVDPDGALAQAEGSSLWGASLALHEGTEFVNGQFKDTNLDTYTPLRMGDVPEMEIEFLPSTEVPVGLGEPCTTVVGPAIANAIYAAVGARMRHIPIRPAAVLEALAKAS
jgi:CO/xanthine dehydrogenase Mo-binding subunit